MASNSTTRSATDCASAQLGASVSYAGFGFGRSSLSSISSLHVVTRVLVGQNVQHVLVGLVLLVIPT